MPYFSRFLPPAFCAAPRKLSPGEHCRCLAAAFVCDSSQYHRVMARSECPMSFCKVNASPSFCRHMMARALWKVLG